jgi:hypothetical protein
MNRARFFTNSDKRFSRDLYFNAALFISREALQRKFAIRPQSVEMGALSLGSINDPDGFGVGHLPLSRGTFGSWAPGQIPDRPGHG